MFTAKSTTPMLFFFRRAGVGGGRQGISPRHQPDCSAIVGGIRPSALTPTLANPRQALTWGFGKPDSGGY